MRDSQEKKKNIYIKEVNKYTKYVLSHNSTKDYVCKYEGSKSKQLQVH